MYQRMCSWNNSAEFASRWKRELEPRSIRDGKSIAKDIAKEAKETGNKFLSQRHNLKEIWEIARNLS